MKLSLTLFLSFYLFGYVFSYNAYDKIGIYDIITHNWPPVKLKGKYGFIYKEGKEVVKPIYDSVEMFDVRRESWAAVKINGKQTFIDKEGMETFLNP